MSFDQLLFWKHKTPSDNAWHPEPGENPSIYPNNLPPWMKRMDIEAATVDTGPWIAGAGGFAHLRQLNDLGWTAPASIFRNKTTMMAMHRTVLYLTPMILLCQAAEIDYRNYIPRWAHDREKRRDEAEVRQQVNAGMGIGLLIWTTRMYVLNVGRAYWAPLDIIMGGALADLAHREYVKAHGM